MQELIDAVLRLGSDALSSEVAACDAVVALLFPNGIVCPRCGSACERELAQVACRAPRRKRHHFTILVDTPFGSKLRPRVRPLLLAIRAFAVSPRSVPARELARDVDMPATTLWRHLHTLRALMPPPSAHPTALAATVQLCGRRSTAPAGWVRAGARVALARERVACVVERAAATASGEAQRMVGESVRTLLNGTFRGVTTRWLSAYLDEARLRWRVRSRAATVLVERLLSAAHALTFDEVRMHFSAFV